MSLVCSECFTRPVLEWRVTRLCAPFPLLQPAAVLPVVRAVFSLPWTGGSYHRATHPVAPGGHADRGAEAFRGVQPYSAKSWFLRDVAPGDRVLQAGRPEGSGGVKAEEGRGVEQWGGETAVAAAAVGAGCVVVIGDLNAEWETAALVRRLCGVHGVAPHRGAAANVLDSF